MLVKNMVLLFLREHKGAKNYFPVPNKWGNQKFDHSRLQGVSFCRRG